MPSISRLEQLVRADVDGARVGVRQHHWRIPVPPIRFLRRRRLGTDALRLECHPVNAVDESVLRLRKNHPVIGGINQTDETVAALHRLPAVVADAVLRPGGTRAAPGVVVLQAAAHVVRLQHVVANVIELTDGQMRQPHPRLAFVVGDADAAVAANHHVIAVLWIDPHRVKVDVNRAGAVGAKGLATVVTHLQRRGGRVDAQIILRIDADDAEVHRAHVGATHFRP